MNLRPAPRFAASYLLAWLLALLLPLAALAQQVPARPQPPRLVSDLAGILQPAQAAALEQKLRAYNDSTSSQIAVVTVPDLGGADIFSYAQKLFQQWGIGQKGKDNGILLLVALQEHQARIQTGSGMEGAVPDALAKRIITYRLVPAFRQQLYYQGLDQATDDLFALLKGEYKADNSQTDDTAADENAEPALGGVLVTCFFVLLAPGTAILVLLIFLWKNRGRRAGKGSLTSGSTSTDTGSSSDDSSSSTSSSFDDDDDFGGGSSDGGGASGSW